MHSGKELTALYARKSAVCERIGRRRHEMAADAGRVLRPLAQVDQGLRLWRRLPGFARSAAIPVVFGLAQLLIPRLKSVRSLLGWAPMAMTGWRVLRGFWRGAREGTAQS